MLFDFLLTVHLFSRPPPESQIAGEGTDFHFYDSAANWGKRYIQICFSYVTLKQISLHGNNAFSVPGFGLLQATEH